MRRQVQFPVCDPKRFYAAMADQHRYVAEISVASSNLCGRTRYTERPLSKQGSESISVSNGYILTSISDDFHQFIKFVNMLMSDTTFHLEESLTSLAKINSVQAQKSNEETWAGLEKSERDDLEAQLRQAESQAPFHTVTGLDNVELIKAITATAKEPFVTSEIVDRLAAVSCSRTRYFC